MTGTDRKVIARPARLEPTTPWFIAAEVHVSNCCYIIFLMLPVQAFQLSFTVFYGEPLKSP